jgi:thiol-disulfide isomerase/thioredoxin
VRPPIDSIQAPPFPVASEWLNSPALNMTELRGRPVLIEFWDFCRPNSLHTLPYLKAWHERYAADGLVVVSVHSPGFRASANERSVRAAVARLGIEHAVMLDSNFALWQDYENAGWPGRYLWSPDGMLADYHYGEGAYAECEHAICALLELEREPLAPLRPEDEPDAILVVPSEDRLTEPFSGPYEAGAAWAVLDPGRPGALVEVNGRQLAVEHPGAHLLAHHERHARGELAVELGPGVRCDGVCFTPGLQAQATDPDPTRIDGARRARSLRPVAPRCVRRAT